MAQEHPSTIGRYEIVDRIGRGGMGVVFKAKDPRIGRQVAIKLLSVTDESLRDRFVQEAQSVGNLAHRNIVTIFDFGEHEGQAYIVMEYVEGVTLADQIHDSVPIPMWRKLEIIEELASGLDYAHNKGIVHRDVKPANVMTDREGVVKILDFGIARVGNIAMTQAGMMLGSPNYMSPEQFESGRVDRRSDIFSVGVLLYELLSYRKAFTGEQVWDVMKAVMSKTPPPLSEFVPGIDPAIEAAVFRAIEKDPSKRYQTLAEMSADLVKARARIPYRQAARDSDTVLAPPPHEAPRTPRPFTDRELISRRRAERIDAYLKEAQTAFDAGEFGTAVEACDQALLLDPDDGRIHALIDRARHALDHQQAIEVLADARSAFERNDLEKAAAQVDQAIQLDASFQDARALKGTIDERIRQRDAEHKKRQEELAAAQQMVQEQKRQFAEGHWHDALGALERYTPRLEVIAAAIADLRSEMAELDRRAREEEEQQKREQAEAQRRWVARQFDLAKRAMANQQFVEAIEILEHVKRNSSSAPGLADLLKQAVQGKSAAEEAIRRKEEIAQVLQRATAEASRGKLLEARSLVASALSIDPAHPEALDKLREIKNAIEAEERQKQEAARQREAERLRREKEEAAAAEARAKKEQEIATAEARAQRERDAKAAEARAKQEREAAAAAAAEEARIKREKEAAAAAEARARREEEAAAAVRAKQEREAAAAAEARAKKERKAAAAAEARAKKEQEAAAAARVRQEREAASTAQAKQERDAATKPAQMPAVAPPAQSQSGKSTTIGPPVPLYTPVESPQPRAEASSSGTPAASDVTGGLAGSTPAVQRYADTLSHLTSQASKLPPKVLAAAGGAPVLLSRSCIGAPSGGSTPDRSTPAPAPSQTAAPTPAPTTIAPPARRPRAGRAVARTATRGVPQPRATVVGRGDWPSGVATANRAPARKDDPELQKILNDAPQPRSRR
jgi:serine/threonine-protein kinase